jgi:hypothetical protein
MGLNILKMPFRAPQANAFCERPVGTIRRECLDFLIPLNESHLRRILKQWVAHYNQSRPHSSLGPGDSSTLRRHAGATRFRLRYSVWSPGGWNSRLGRSALRIPAGEVSGLKSEQKIRNDAIFGSTRLNPLK